LEKLIVVGVKRNVLEKFCVWLKSIFTHIVLSVKSARLRYPREGSLQRIINIFVQSAIKNTMVQNVQNAMNMLKVKLSLHWEIHFIKSASHVQGAKNLFQQVKE
jgi:hypothetical protein